MVFGPNRIDRGTAENDLYKGKLKTAYTASATENPANFHQYLTQDKNFSQNQYPPGPTTIRMVIFTQKAPEKIGPENRPSMPAVQ